MLDRKIFVWEREFSRSVLRLGIPIALQALLSASLHIIDNIMVSQLGDAAMAGVTQANRVSFLFQLTMFGAVSGTGVFTAQYWSGKDVKNIRRVMGMGLIVALSVAALFAIPSTLFPKTLLRLLIKDEVAQNLGATYLRIVAIGFFMQSLSLLLSSILRSTEKVILPMAASMAAILLNTALNFLLISGRLGFPALGAKGAAMGTVISASLETILLIAFSYIRRYATAARLHELKVSMNFARKYLNVVLPVVLNEGFWSLGVAVYSAGYGQMGDGKTIVAGIGVFNNVEQLSTILLRGVTHAAAIMTGMAVGSGDKELSMLYAKRFLFGSAMAGLVAGVLLLSVTGGILSAYKGISKEAIEVARYIITVYALMLWMKGMCTQLIIGVLRPGGDVLFSMFIDVVPLWVISIPLTFFFGVALGFPIQMVYPITLIEEAAKAIFCYIRMRSGKWIHNLTEQPIT